MKSSRASFHFGNLAESVKPRFKPEAPLEMKYKKSSPKQSSEPNSNMKTAYENSVDSKKATQNAREAVKAFISYAEATKTNFPRMNVDDVSIDGLLEYIRHIELKENVDATITVALDLALSAVKFAHLINTVAKISSSANSAKRKTRGDTIRDMKETFAAVVKDIRAATSGVDTIFRDDKIKETLYEALESNGIELPDEKEWDPPEELLEDFESALHRVIRVSKECSQSARFNFKKGGGYTRRQKNRKGTNKLGGRRFTAKYLI